MTKHCDYYTREAVRDALKILAVLAIVAGLFLMWDSLFNRAHADDTRPYTNCNGHLIPIEDCPRMAIDPCGTPYYLDTPIRTEQLERMVYQFNRYPELYPVWMIPSVVEPKNVLELLERALKYIPDYQDNDSPTYGFENAVIHYTNPIGRQKDAIKEEENKLKRMEEAVKLHNEIKALIKILKEE